MQRLTFLNSKDIKKLKEIIIAQFGYFPAGDYAFLRNEKDKIYLINNDIAKLNLRNLIIDKIGLYFAEVKHYQVRLSKEGAQLVGREAQKKKIKLKNTVKLTKEEITDYFRGVDLDKDLNGENGFILLQYQNDIIGCAKYKDKKILNFLPKLHRGEVIL